MSDTTLQFKSSNGGDDEMEEYATKRQLSDLEQKMDHHFGKTDDRLNIIDQKLDLMNQRFDHVDERFELMNRRFDLVNDKLIFRDKKLNWIFGIQTALIIAGLTKLFLA